MTWWQGFRPGDLLVEADGAKAIAAAIAEAGANDLVLVAGEARGLQIMALKVR